MNKALRELLFSVDKLWPPRLGNMAAWYDSLDQSTLLAGNGTTITDGGAVALWGDKSGNSGVNCLVLPGVAANYASVADEAALRITGSIELRWRGRLPSYATGAIQSLNGRYHTSSNQRSYSLTVAATGHLAIAVSSDGTALNSETIVSDATLASVGIGVFSLISLAATWTAGTRKTKFWYSADGVAWTQLGGEITGTTVNSIHAGTAALEIGAITGGTLNLVAGNTHSVQVINTATATTVLDIDFSTAGKKLANGDTFTCATGQTVTLNSSGATGARIAGERDLFQGTAANRPVYLAYAGTKYGYLNGAAGNYFSTPDDDKFDITADIDLRAYVSMADWSPAANTYVISKWLVTGVGPNSFTLGVRADGTLELAWSTTGSDAISKVSTANLSATANNAALWIRATLDVDNGSTQNEVKFYTSADGVTWTQLGATVTTAGITSIFSSTTALQVSGLNLGANNNVTGRIYRAQIYDAIGAVGGNPLITIGPDATDASRKADFNPALYSSGTTFTASTGEVWTINGGAHIVTRTGLYGNGSTHYLQSAKFSQAQPETRYATFSQISWTNADRIAAGVNSSTALIYQTTSSPGLSIYGGTAAVALADALPLQTCGTVSGVYNSSASSVRKNRGAASTGNSGTAASDGVTLFADGGAGNLANAFISEFAVYSAAHPTATQDRMVLAMGRKHRFSV